MEQSQSYLQDGEHQRLVQMRRKRPAVSRECDIWEILDRSAAAITSGVLQDLGITDEIDSSSVID